jgi:hypothetical protein
MTRMTWLSTSIIKSDLVALFGSSVDLKKICLRYVLSESESFICCLSPGIKTILGIENECCKLISGSSSLERKKYSMDQVS